MSPEQAPRRLTDKHRANISKGVKEALSTPQMSKKLSIVQQKIWDKNPQRKEEQSQIQLMHWQNPERRAKMSKSHTGIPVSKDARRKISEKLKGKPSPLKGRTMSEEHKAKIAQTRKEQYIDLNFELDMFKIGQQTNIINSIFNEEEVQILKDYFALKKIKKEPGDQVSRLLDTLSIEIAKAS